MTEWWRYPNLESGHPYDWSPAERTERPWDQIDFHLDLGCGRIPKGRLGIDLRYTEGVTDLVMDLNTGRLDVNAMPKDNERLAQLHQPKVSHGPYGSGGYGGLPFPDCSIDSIISHHAMEHIGDGFGPLMDEIYRVLVWGGVFRMIVPLFPSYSAVSDYDHKRYFTPETMIGFTGSPGGVLWSDGFAEPYNDCRFKIIDTDHTPRTDPHSMFTESDQRELRTTLWKWTGHEAIDATPYDFGPGTKL